jgi:Leucine-rich repeat (LRR) protein
MRSMAVARSKLLSAAPRRSGYFLESRAVALFLLTAFSSACGRSNLRLGLTAASDDDASSGGSLATSGGASVTGGRASAKGGAASSGGAATSVGSGGAPSVGGAVAARGGSAGSVGTGGTRACGLLIDDMEDHSGRICTGDGRVGAWYAFNNDSGTQWPIKTAPGVPISDSALLPARAASQYAIHTYGSGFTPWGAGVGFDLAFDGQHYGLYDASAHSGFEFWARGTSNQKVRFRVSSLSSTGSQYGGTCVATCAGPPGATLALGPTWRHFSVSFSELTSVGGLRADELDRLTNVQFMPIDFGRFDFWVDDVSFTDGPRSCCPDLPACQGNAVDFADAALATAAVSLFPSDGVVDCSEVCRTRRLSATAQGISSLEGVECLDSLGELDLTRNGVGSLSSLRALTGLVSLTLAENSILDLEPLTGLYNLATLDLRQNFVSDLAPLAGLESLSVLNLSKNHVQSAAALAKLAHLFSVDLSDNLVSDPSALSGHSELQTLNLANNRVTALGALSNLPALTSLDLTGNAVVSSGPLIGLEALVTLRLGENRLTDISALSTLPKLGSLELNDNRIENISALAAASGMWFLRLDDNRIRDPSPLANLSKLYSLDLAHNQIADERLLAGIVIGRSLDLSGNQLQWISSDATWLTVDLLNLADNELATLPSLAGRDFQVLDLSGNQLTDIRGLIGVQLRDQPCERCSTPGVLNLSGNPITDVSPLLQTDFVSGVKIDLTNTSISCVDQAPVLAALRARLAVVTTSCD